MVLGLVLVVIAVAVAAFGIAFNASAGPAHPLSAFGAQVVTATPLEIFLGGIAVTLVFCLGVWALAVAGRRRRALRSEVRATRRERDELAAQLDRQQVAEPVVDATPKQAVDH
ncbi:hypothetical protein GCM10010174_34200 [Kutzneria viridogrisea]|uniref:Heme/copper-type cytochrome/quinol oxidase subunit 2 n=2 Tax=Kutzneria TaxID=43356 RepID=A0ABR6BLY2_9PSEU|nr:hypothetical protein [Kutzneria albida]AHH96865.1 putative secreted protein [Kutzneria albida DSM 43870]MBA8927912.1 heme/copper-type cytochrome/quinol oxidase subunit 2 [Kutzneria viridogrisea]